MHIDKDHASFAGETLIIIVLYKENLYTAPSFKSFSDMLSGINTKIDFFVYDNSPTPEFREQNMDNINIHYVSDPSNPGVGRAYNEGCKVARRLGKKWMLFADQDTIFSKDLIHENYNATIKYPNIHLFVPRLMQKNILLSPCKYVHHIGRMLPNINSGVQNFIKKSVLNSGMLISVESFSRTGGFNENIKLDFADFLFINKYKKLYNDFFVTNSICSHELSSFEKDVEKVLTRFKIYCRDARTYADCSDAFLILSYIVFRRTLNLLFKYKRIAFVKIFLKNFISHN